MKTKILVLAVFLVTTLSGQSMAAAYADIAFVIDQSGSMGGEFSWLGNSINTINNTIISDSSITGVNYGVAGYEDTTGSQYSVNAWVDITSDISSITTEVNSVGTYGGTEYAYSAASWAADNFSWSGGAYAKVMVLITDEDPDDRFSYSYAGLTGEAAIAQKMQDENILLNVITLTTLYNWWDTVAYVNPSTSFQGLFSLTELRDNPEQFTADFTAAKLAEILIVDPDPVPEPSTFVLFGSGLLGLVYFRKKAKK